LQTAPTWPVNIVLALALAVVSFRLVERLRELRTGSESGAALRGEQRQHERAEILRIEAATVAQPASRLHVQTMAMAGRDAEATFYSG
jgi:hypothetical protein